MSAQKAELIALTKALDLGAGKKINIYTDSRYAFAPSHVQGAIYQQMGLLTSNGREGKNKAEAWEVVAHAINLSTWKAKAGRFLSLRPAWSTK
jgi:ribonuclease HI